MYTVFLQNRSNLYLALKVYINYFYIHRRLIKFVHRNHKFSLNNAYNNAFVYCY